MLSVRLRIEPLPVWLDVVPLLGPDAEPTCESLDREGLPAHQRVTVVLPAPEAADVAARLRGLGFDGREVLVSATPPLGRALVREARLREARARRETTPGFVRPGARASGEGRFSLTPEVLALALGELAEGASVVDACCGSGGNAIGFARAGCAVTALELDPARLAEARHNAALYGVAERIDFRLGDARELLPTLRAELLFVDPPWGAEYNKRSTTLADFPLLSALLGSDLSRFRELWLKLPGSFRVDSIDGASARAWFGRARGDAQRVKFVMLRVPTATKG